jgi:hypothetical protein
MPVTVQTFGWNVAAVHAFSAVIACGVHQRYAAGTADTLRLANTHCLPSLVTIFQTAVCTLCWQQATFIDMLWCQWRCLHLPADRYCAAITGVLPADPFILADIEQAYFLMEDVFQVTYAA